MKYPYEESRYEIPVPGFQAGARFRMALLSDLHNCPYDEILPLLEAAKPDAVLCCGDMINCPRFPRKPAYDTALSFYRELAARFPVYAVPGNHEERWENTEDESLREDYARFREQLSESGVVFLENSSVSLEAGGTKIVLAGVALDHSNYLVTKRCRAVLREGQMKAMLGLKSDVFTVLLAHTPNGIEQYAEWGADLVLSGHVHGGIVRIPKHGGVVGPGFVPFPTYTKGKYRVGETTLLVSAGLGEHFIPLRVANPRQIIYAELTEAPHGL